MMMSAELRELVSCNDRCNLLNVVSEVIAVHLGNVSHLVANDVLSNIGNKNN